MKPKSIKDKSIKTVKGYLVAKPGDIKAQEKIIYEHLHLNTKEALDFFVGQLDEESLKSLEITHENNTVYNFRIRLLSRYQRQFPIYELNSIQVLMGVIFTENRELLKTDPKAWEKEVTASLDTLFSKLKPNKALEWLRANPILGSIIANLVSSNMIAIIAVIIASVKN